MLFVFSEVTTLTWHKKSTSFHTAMYFAFGLTDLTDKVSDWFVSRCLSLFCAVLICSTFDFSSRSPPDFHRSVDWNEYENRIVTVAENTDECTRLCRWTYCSIFVVSCQDVFNNYFQFCFIFHSIEPPDTSNRRNLSFEFHFLLISGTNNEIFFQKPIASSWIVCYNIGSNPNSSHFNSNFYHFKTIP